MMPISGKLTYRYGCEVERPQLLANLLEGLAVGGVAAEPEAAVALGAEHGPAAPEGLALVERGSCAPVVSWSKHEPDGPCWAQDTRRYRITKVS